jgi:hypothetical protein
MQFSRLDRAAKPDIEAASDQQWESASGRATVLQNLLEVGVGRRKSLKPLESLACRRLWCPGCWPDIV